MTRYLDQDQGDGDLAFALRALHCYLQLLLLPGTFHSISPKTFILFLGHSGYFHVFSPVVVQDGLRLMQFSLHRQADGDVGDDVDGEEGLTLLQKQSKNAPEASIGDCLDLFPPLIALWANYWRRDKQVDAALSLLVELAHPTLLVTLKSIPCASLRFLTFAAMSNF